MFTRVIGQRDHASVCASWTVCLTNRVFSQNTLFLDLSISRGNQIMWLSWIEFLAGLKHWFQMCTLTVFRAETQTHSFIQTCTHSLILSVGTRKAASLSWGLQKFIDFFSSTSAAPGFWWKLAEVYTVTLPLGGQAAEQPSLSFATC